MSLFPSKIPYAPSKPKTATPVPFGVRRRVIVIDEPTLPDFVRRLREFCNDPSHLPCWVRYVNDGVTTKGYPFARYRCPICGTEQGWGVNRKTGQPLRLFVAKH